MAAITSLTGLLIASSSGVVCTPLDLPGSDRLEVHEAAQTFLRERGIDESSSELQYQKCGYRIPDNPPAKRAEQVKLIALLEEQSDQAGESTRDRVDCYVFRFWVLISGDIYDGAHSHTVFRTAEPGTYVLLENIPGRTFVDDELTLEE